MDDDTRHMELALVEAQAAKATGEWPFGAVIVSNGEVISQSHCAEKATKNVLSHAELQAVNEACKTLGRNNLSDCVIYCTNEPCLMCASAILQAKIPKIVIGASRADLPHLLRERKLSIEILVQDAGYEVEVVRGIHKDTVLALFSDVVKG